jgi:hypothetical protein
MINYLLVPIIAFLGFPIGLFLSFVSPEEMKSGKKYFELIQHLLLVFILFFIFDYYSFQLIISIIITITVFLGVFYWHNDYKSIIFYLILAVLLYFSSKNLSLFALESSLIFMYGVPTGSLIKCRKKDSLNIVAKHSIFILLAILLLLFF